MRLIIVFAFFCTLHVTSQRLTISGIAKKSNDNGFTLITLNDTLKKLPRDYPEALYEELWNKKEVVKMSDEKGNFSIDVEKHDTLVFSDIDHISQKHAVIDLIKREHITIILEKLPCVEYNPCRKESSEDFIFIGSKLGVEVGADTRYCNVISLDIKFDARYRVMQNIVGTLNDTVEFVSYDHFSKVKYQEYENVILFLGKYCDRLIHKKYQYHPVYKTKDGRWAVPVFEDYDPKERVSQKRPNKVRMIEPIHVPDYLSCNDLPEIYPKPYFKIKNGKVYMRYGFYPEDLIYPNDKNSR